MQWIDLDSNLVKLSVGLLLSSLNWTADRGDEFEVTASLLVTDSYPYFNQV